MKKMVFYIGIIALSFMVCGCNKINYQNVECTLTSNDPTQNYSLESTYSFTAENNIVNKVKTIEVINSDDDDVLDYFEEYITKTYKAYNDTYGGYTYDINKSSNKLTVTVNINYNDIDMESFVKDNSSLASYLNSNNKFTKDKMIQMYKSLGAICK